jgi:integrase/recombinase XerD
MPGYGQGRIPKSKGLKYPPHPLSPTEVFALLNACEPNPGRALRWDERVSALRLRALIAVLWRTGLRISEALALDADQDLNPVDQTVLVRHGKGDKRRVVGMDPWGWRELEAWMVVRRQIRPGAVFCVLAGPTEGRAIHDSDVRRALHAAGRRAGLNRRVNPHALRHTLAVDLFREGVPELVIQRQLGHARLDVTQGYLRGLDPREVLERVIERRGPTMPVPNLMQTLSQTQRTVGAPAPRALEERT